MSQKVKEAIINPQSQEYSSNGELAQPKIASTNVITPTPYDKKNINMTGLMHNPLNKSNPNMGG